MESAKAWAKEAVVLAGLVGKQKAKEPDSEYQARIDAEATKLIKKVIATGEFYLVRAGNTRKGTGTFYTRPQLAVPTVHRTLEPLCYEETHHEKHEKNEKENQTTTKTVDSSFRDFRVFRGDVPKTPEEILGLKVCDPACGSASFLVAALHYLADALYKSLCYHCKLDDPEQAKKLTLPYGRPRTGKVGEALAPFPPDDPQRGHTFEDRVKALLRRHVVERCIYGVDINPLAVEFARVSLWVETLDPELPFSFLDHKIKVGNSLVGCWLDRMEDYPLKAWEREGGDGKKGPRTQRIETLLKGELHGNRRTGDGRIKREMRQIIERRFQGQPPLFADEQATPQSVIAQERDTYERLHELPIADPDEREKHYREQIENSPPLLALKRAMDEWCAVWFWPANEEALQHVPMPLQFHHEKHERHENREEIVRRLKAEVKFFHWELEFPDVFCPLSFSAPSVVSSGFDALIGNPPWDVMKPNSQEFFTEIDPLYRTYDKQTALRRQKELFATVPALAEQWDEYNARFKALGNWARNAAEPFDGALARGREGENLKSVWQRHRQQRIGFADPRHPFRLQGSADLNSYKMFAEAFWNLLRPDGRLGVILPTGIYSDFGTKDLREELLLRGRLEFLYAFQNEKKIFVAADHRYKQTVVFATKGGSTRLFRTRFRMGVGDSPEAQEIPDDILSVGQALLPDHAEQTGKSACPTSSMVCTPDDVRANSPKTLSLVELKSQRDLDIFRKIYAHSIRIGDNAPGWEITYAREFDMTNDSKHFPPREQWEAKGYKPDVFGRWIDPDGDVALPFYQGVTINQFDFSQKGWEAGLGRSAVWREIPFDAKTFRPKFLIGFTSLRANKKYYPGPKLAYRRVARSTDTRSFISSVVVGFGCGDKLPVLKLGQEQLPRTIYLTAVCNSLTFDYVARTRNSGTQIDWHILAEFPLPAESAFQSELVKRAARLTFLHRRFAPEWLRLKHLYPELAAREWKHWWAVTEADRLRLRVEIDALCADLYGLDPDDYDWIVRDDSSDPKGFYRVDRNLPFRERLTGLAAAAFRALKEGKWSVGQTLLSDLSNDEFFEILGIPEMTRQTGVSAPLIQKRDGCHRWKPEEFGKDDPRHGWTWDHCRQDAAVLLQEFTTKNTKDTKKEEKEEKKNRNAESPSLFDEQ